MTERWVKMVEKWHKKNSSAMGLLTDAGAVKLLARQHRAMVKLVESTLSHEISSLDNERSATMRKRYRHTVSVLERLLAALAKQGAHKKD